MFRDFSIVIAENLKENISEQDILSGLKKNFQSKIVGCVTVSFTVESYLYPINFTVDFINKIIWVYKHKDYVGFLIDPDTDEKSIILLD